MPSSETLRPLWGVLLSPFFSRMGAGLPMLRMSLARPDTSFKLTAARRFPEIYPHFARPVVGTPGAMPKGSERALASFLLDKR